METDGGPMVTKKIGSDHLAGSSGFEIQDPTDADATINSTKTA